jgi:very-short-patch-repair endonuclease
MGFVRGVPFGQIPFAARHAIHKAQLRNQATPAERWFCSYLDKRGLTYRFQQGFYTPYYRIVDFYLPDYDLIVEIDGPYHDREEDARRDRWFTSVRKIPILRLTNEQVFSGAFELSVSVLAGR